MSSTNKTINLNLSQYEATDKPTYLIDYNEDMRLIDEAVDDLQNTKADKTDLAGYLPLTGGALTGDLKLPTGLYNSGTNTYNFLRQYSDGKIISTTPDQVKSVLGLGEFFSSSNKPVGYILSQYTIDASALDQDTWYPVVWNIGLRRNIRCEIIVSLDSGTKPYWSTHESGFSVRKIWETNESGWGKSIVSRRVLVSNYSATSVDPVRGIGQISEIGNEYVFVRGGGKYYFYTSNGGVPTLHQDGYQGWAGKALYPTTELPDEIVVTLPSPSDIGALPIGGGNITGELYEKNQRVYSPNNPVFKKIYEGNATRYLGDTNRIYLILPSSSSNQFLVETGAGSYVTLSQALIISAPQRLIYGNTQSGERYFGFLSGTENVSAYNSKSYKVYEMILGE